MSTLVDSAELRALSARLLYVERERADARDQAATLLALAEAFTAIARARSTEDIIALILHTAYAQLGFKRAIYFAVDRECGVVARFSVDGSDTVETCDAYPNLLDEGAFVALLRGEDQEGTGVAGELSAPIVDVRHWYVMSPLVRAESTLGVLYVDDHTTPGPATFESTLVRALATIAAVSIDNAMLFAKAEELAMRDSLTGLFNRRAFANRAQLEFDRARQHSIAYIVLDVDDFKTINDRHGHAHGDAVLRLLATILARNSREQDVVGRYAGDEFLALMIDVDADTARTLVARLSQDLRQAGLRCSIGAALFPQDGADMASVFTAADRALYATKAAGKNGYSFV